MNLELGRCYEFTLQSGQTKKLRLMGGNPLRWIDGDCNELVGDLNYVLGDLYRSYREVPCWQCP